MGKTTRTGKAEDVVVTSMYAYLTTIVPAVSPALRLKRMTGPPKVLG